GERTGEKGTELWGEICIENRGVMRFTVTARAEKIHTGVAQPGGGALVERLLVARAEIMAILQNNLRLTGQDGWHTQVQNPFVQVGEPGVYNISPGEATFGVEVRPIPEEDLAHNHKLLTDYCSSHSLEMNIKVMQAGVRCPADNPFLQCLQAAYVSIAGQEPQLGRKLPATSARFAPGGRAVVWGQSGIGPHARDERHYIPSILPYYRVLNEFGQQMASVSAGGDGGAGAGR
ncbi:MAG: peptidase dimerization domain-containing protein, partial [Anaerolineales bacterium]|nr:peptidase dimerization domain-containing protein [Anaerolineales bacterium]